MAKGELQGWYQDPFRLHEARYFSAGRPTKLVRDGSAERYDEPPFGAYEPADAAAGAEGSGLGPAPAWGGPAGQAPDLAGAGGAYAYSPGFAPGGPRRSRKGRLAAVAVIAVAAVVAVVLAAVNGSRSATGPDQAHAISPVAFVTRSAGQTLAERTADLTLSGTVQASRQSVAVSGTGEANFSANAMTLELDYSASGRSAIETEILIQGNLFYTEIINGQSLAQLTGGREWIQMPTQQSGSANLIGSDPLSSLSVLEQRGNAVRMLGTKIVDGVSCRGYAVTPGKQAMIAAVRKQIANLGLSPAVGDLELSLVQGMSPPTLTVWIDAQGLMQQMSVGLQMSALGTSVSANMVVDFSHFGAPVLITAPAPSDTISYKSFLQTIGLSGTS
jgi:hypothetical protein